MRARGTDATDDSSYPPLWPALALYALWIYLDQSPEHAGRLSMWFRSVRFWRYFAEYYPASCVLHFLRFALY